MPLTVFGGQHEPPPYGAALNEGRALFGDNDDYNFGKWKQANVYPKLGESASAPSAPEESAAMWAIRRAGWVA